MTRRVRHSPVPPLLAFLALVGLVVPTGHSAVGMEAGGDRFRAVATPASPFLAGGASPLESTLESTDRRTIEYGASAPAVANDRSGHPSASARTTNPAGRADHLAAGWPSAPPRAPPVRPF